MKAGRPIGEAAHSTRRATRRLLRVFHRVLLAVFTLLALLSAAVCIYGKWTHREADIVKRWGGMSSERFIIILSLESCWSVSVEFVDYEGAKPGASWEWDAQTWSVFVWWQDKNPFNAAWTFLAWDRGPWKVGEPFPDRMGRGFAMAVPSSFPPVLFGAWPFLALVRFAGRHWRRYRRRTRGFCVRCGYNLRGLTSPRCPECGVEFEPSFERPRNESAERGG
jgi:hypothetical protein